MQKKLFDDSDEKVDWPVFAKETLNNVIAIWERILSRSRDTEFIGNGPFTISERINQQLNDLVSNQIKFGDDDQKVGDRLKYVIKNETDIDRNGPRAAVLPFAQKEMVDRFLHGLDEAIERQLTQFSESAITKIRETIVGQITHDNDDEKEKFEEAVKAAEEAFISGLKTDAFQAIQKNSQSEIESLIEFMPKPELAKMAEALVNLTSIKKRVSRGMDTVGGPIDVAVISEAEGFVWVKRKHYFPSDLNPRYLRRVEQAMYQEAYNAKSNARSSRKGKRSVSEKRSPCRRTCSRQLRKRRRL
jgi:hypothetical protein